MAGLIISSALIIWKSLMLVTRSESPVSGCMHTTFCHAPRSPVSLRPFKITVPNLTLPCYFPVINLQVVVVLSGSMEPGFYRGDILFLNMGYAPIRTGEIVVFNIDGRDIPIVHRVIKVHDRDSGGDVDILTKVRHV